MAEPEQQKQPETKEGGFSIFKFKQWPPLILNWAVRLPLIERLHIGRVRVGAKPHPLKKELEDKWLAKNDRMFKQLETIEKRWILEQNLLGFGGKAAPLVDGNPEGIVPMYSKLGHYADIIDLDGVNRIEIEKDWFQFGTGFKEVSLMYELPPEPEWEKLGWHSERVKKLEKEDIAKSWKKIKIRKFKLDSGVVLHEGKEDLKEELYCFGYSKIRRFGNAISEIVKKIDIENLRNRKVQVEIRTTMANTLEVLRSLFETVAKIEEENYKMLSKLVAESKRTWKERWIELIDNRTPENVGGITTRFRHTFRIIKIYHMQVVENEKIKRVDDDGNIYEEKEKGTSCIRIYFDPKKNQYAKELEEVKRKIQDSGGESKLKRKADKYYDVAKIASDRAKKIDDAIKPVRSKLIKEDYKKKLIEDLNKELKTGQSWLGGWFRSETTISEKQTQDFLSGVAGKIDELAESEEAESKKKTVELSKLVIDQLLDKFGIKDEEDIKTIKSELGLLHKEIKEGEEEKEEERIKKLKDIIQKLNKIIYENYDSSVKSDRLDELRRRKALILAFKNTAVSKRKETLEELLFRKEQLELYNTFQPKNPRFWKRPEEIEYGLDENGWPLEIDPEDKGRVLIDKWWSEIAQNEWQLETIALKPGGADVLKRHLGADVEYYEGEDEITKKKKLRAKVKNCKRDIRYVDDDKFYGWVDLLDAGTIIFGMWDTVRDDYRDGRYHLHSKHVGDYVIEGMGGFDENRGAPYLKAYATISKGKGLGITRRGMIHKAWKSAALKGVDPKDHEWQIKAKPSNFEDVEKEISRNFKMRISEEVTKMEGYSDRNSLKKIERTPFGLFYKDVRKPTKYSCAFDRRAEQFEYMHWGVMYYYEWSQNCNKWSENPFPHISTRGIAFYIAFLAASDVWYYQEAEELLEGHQFDYGVRGQGEFKEVNPLSGKNVLQEN